MYLFLIRGIVLGGLLGGVSFSNAYGSETPYSLLRSMFYGATLPTVDELQIGKTWSCTADIRGAKRQFRYAKNWEEKYIFTLEDVLSPWKTRGAYTVTWYEGDYELGVESLRVNQYGDLIVEQLMDRPLDKNSKESHLHPGHWAVGYVICENPSVHDDRDWHRDRMNYFSLVEFR